MKTKKDLHQKWSPFFPQIQVDTYAQMHIRVKLLGGCRCRPYSNYWGDTVKLLGGFIPPSSPGFGTPVCRYIFFVFLVQFFVNIANNCNNPAISQKIWLPKRFPQEQNVRKYPISLNDQSIFELEASIISRTSETVLYQCIIKGVKNNLSSCIVAICT